MISNQHLPTLKQFLNNLYEWPSNSYINHDNFNHLYLRKGNYQVNQQILPITIQIANVEVKKSGQNCIKQLCDEIKKYYPNIPIIAENILDENLHEKILKLGFVRINENIFPTSFVLY